MGFRSNGCGRTSSSAVVSAGLSGLWPGLPAACIKAPSNAAKEAYIYWRPYSFRRVHVEASRAPDGVPVAWARMIASSWAPKRNTTADV